MKILLVEDNHLFGEFIGAHIDGVTAVETLRDALALLNTERFDLLLIDLGLPDSQGMDTLRAFAGFKIPKIVMTARGGLLKEAMATSICDFIHKGDPREIVERIQFNINKLTKKRVRFAPEIFAQLKSCLEMSSVRQLVPA